MCTIYFLRKILSSKKCCKSSATKTKEMLQIVCDQKKMLQIVCDKKMLQIVTSKKMYKSSATKPGFETAIKRRVAIVKYGRKQPKSENQKITELTTALSKTLLMLSTQNYAVSFTQTQSFARKIW